MEDYRFLMVSYHAKVENSTPLLSQFCDSCVFARKNTLQILWDCNTMIIKKNAEAIVKEQLSRDNVVATRKALETNINHSYRHKFFQELQIYVTKIAIALDHCIEDINLGRNYYAGSIEFICKKIIKKEKCNLLIKYIACSYTLFFI